MTSEIRQPAIREIHIFNAKILSAVLILPKYNTKQIFKTKNNRNIDKNLYLSKICKI